MHPDDVAQLKRLGIYRDGHIDRHELDRLLRTSPTAGMTTADLQLMLSCLGTPIHGLEPQPSRRAILVELERRGVASAR